MLSFALHDGHSNRTELNSEEDEVRKTLEPDTAKLLITKIRAEALWIMGEILKRLVKLGHESVSELRP